MKLHSPIKVSIDIHWSPVRVKFVRVRPVLRVSVNVPNRNQDPGVLGNLDSTNLKERHY